MLCRVFLENFDGHSNQPHQQSGQSGRRNQQSGYVSVGAHGGLHIGTSMAGGPTNHNNSVRQPGEGLPNGNPLHNVHAQQKAMQHPLAQPQMPGLFAHPQQASNAGPFSQSHSHPAPSQSMPPQPQQQAPITFSQAQMPNSVHAQGSQHIPSAFSQPQASASSQWIPQQAQQAPPQAASGNGPASASPSADLAQVLMTLQASNLPAEEVLSIFTAVTQARSTSAPPPHSRNSGSSSSGTFFFVSFC